MNQFFLNQGYNDTNDYWKNRPDYDSKEIYDIKFVYCPLCSNKAIVKTNKKNKKMLRCDSCYALMFANGPASQQHLLNLPEYQEYY